MNTIESIEAEIMKINEKRSLLVSRKMGVQGRLSKLNSEVSGRRLPREVYVEICDEQNDLKQELYNIDRDIAMLKPMKENLYHMRGKLMKEASLEKKA